jgi:hypothetical protein
MSIDVGKPDLGSLMPDNSQFLIPLYQRPYEWEMTQWKTLWEDLQSAYSRRKSAPSYTHFFGPVVTINFSPLIPLPITQQFLVDGQQRLTTVAVLAKALHDTLADEADADYKNPLQRLFRNSAEDVEHIPKVVPGRNDREAFLDVMGIVKGAENAHSLLHRAHRYFSNQVGEWKSEVSPDTLKTEIHNLFMALIKGFRLVQIGLDIHESCYEIFDSLNRKGTELEPADEVRNYCFMLLATRDEASVRDLYDRYWYPMERTVLEPGAERGPSKDLNHFFQVWGVMSLGEQFAERQVATYLTKLLADRAKRIAQQTLGNGEPSPQMRATVAADFTQEVHGFSSSYRRAHWPVTIDTPGEATVRARIQQANALGVKGAADPLMLILMHRYAAMPGNMDGFMRCIDILESYVVRRALCGISAKQENRIFAGLAHKVYELIQDQPDTTIGSIAASLQSDLQARSDDSDDRWPKDDKLKEGLRLARLYKNRRPLVKMVLRMIELRQPGLQQTSFASYEVEHVMPVDLTAEWKEHLGAEAQSVHEQYKNTIGNLVLLTHEENMATGQLLLAAKRNVYAKCVLVSTRWLCNYQKWGKQEILERADWIFDQVRNLWPR